MAKSARRKRPTTAPAASEAAVEVHHAPKPFHGWREFLKEYAIIVLGVLTALALDQGVQWLQWRQKADQTRSRLIEDLAASERAAVASTRYYADVRTHALAALTALDRPKERLGAPFLIDAYEAMQLWPRSGKHSTYDEIMSSGHAELLGPPVVRDRISNFYWRMDGLLSLTVVTQPYRARMRSLMPYPVQSLIQARCGEVLTDEGAGLVIPRLPETCSISPPKNDVAAAVSQVWSAPGLKQDLTGVVVDLDSKIEQFGKVADGSRELRAYLQKIS
jgi:hypothetical protein